MGRDGMFGRLPKSDGGVLASGGQRGFIGRPCGAPYFSHVAGEDRLEGSVVNIPDARQAIAPAGYQRASASRQGDSVEAQTRLSALIERRAVV